MISPPCCFLKVLCLSVNFGTVVGHLNEEIFLILCIIFKGNLNLNWIKSLFLIILQFKRVSPASALSNIELMIDLKTYFLEYFYGRPFVDYKLFGVLPQEFELSERMFSA